jgi:murein DD-endopeptidase MepM/ murein hydrolase activator NlpD
VDFATNTGTPVRASSDGTVVVVEQFPMYGLVVAVAHGAGLATLYAHLSTVDVAPGGNAYGPHLHFEVRLDGMPVDPARYVDLPPFVGGRPSAPGWVWILRRLRAEARRLVRRPGRRPA